jgi:hypothetical protein
MFALTGGRSVAAGDIDVPPADMARLEPLRDADGMLTYVCVDTLYLRELALRGIETPPFPSVCELAATRMVARGHMIVASGVGWTVMRLNHEEPGAYQDGVS